MVSQNPSNTLLSDLLTDLTKVFNQPFTALQNDGNQELTEISKRLSGMLVQPTSVNVQQYETAKGYLIQNGASEQAAATLALLVANLAALTGKSINYILRQIENAGIRLTEQTYLALNQLRDPESQWFYAEPPDNLDSYNRMMRAIPRCVCPPAEHFRVGDNFATLQIIPYDSIVSAI